VISERTFAQSFSGFWSELLPLLTPAFVHMVNKTYKRNIWDGRDRPVEKLAGSGDPSFTAEFSFFLAKISHEMGLDVEDIVSDQHLVARAAREARREIDRYEGWESVGASDALADVNQMEALALAKNYAHFLRQRERSGLVLFNPKIPGAGFLSSCEADLSIGDSLFEVKTVSRNLAGKDLRQLLIYLALQAATGERQWRSAGFFNPRRANFHEFEVDDLILRMSGGKPALEVFHEIVRFSCSRDMQLDTFF